VIASFVATPILLLIPVISTGAGHGDYFWAKILFPYTMLSTLAFRSITTPFILLAILQFRLYGVALGWANQRHKIVLAGASISALHIVAAIVALLLCSDSFA
jgi:hypothetical protein